MIINFIMKRKEKQGCYPEKSGGFCANNTGIDEKSLNILKKYAGGKSRENLL